MSVGSLCAFMSSKTNSLRQQIYDAFADRPYPGDSRIGVHDYGEGKYVSEFFRGKQWRDVTLEVLLQNYSADASACLGFMTEEAFRYYLPAFLLIALNERLEADVIPEITVSRLLLPEDGSREMDKFLERMGGFTLHEHRAIKAFLEHWQSELSKSGSSVYDARGAIKRYWGKF